MGCLLLLAGLLACGAVRAGTLYRCVGSHGETVFSSSRTGYRDCRSMGSYPDAGVRAAPAPRAPVVSLARVRGSATTTGHVDRPRMTSLAWVRGSVTTTARSLPSPAGARPGQWNYRDSQGAGAAAVARAGASTSGSGARVLRGSVYRVVHADGSVEYTNVRPAGRVHAVTMLFSYIATCFACNLHSHVDWARVPLHLREYADVIHEASNRYGVDEAFLRAIIHAESAFNPDAMSAKGAQGLMQLMPGTANDMGVADAFDADDNILGGARYLGLLLKTFNGNERLAAAAYNAGPAAVERYHGVPPYAETEVYVQRVGELRKRYGSMLRASLADRGPG
ncbi:lytic transglycosylase domain-containing protein [Dyella sp. A6]|uniref:lytic transglycosylase domain-containing protein n=1 Tax=Dyella aluminiiresistens TaxID=3069105 RepID=UPI002E79D034|nr:lytic transglycosylase domain-containing protein [Dyella sp. A6]